MKNNTVCAFNVWALFMKDTTEKLTEVALQEHRIKTLLAMALKTYGLHLGMVTLRCVTMTVIAESPFWPNSY